LLDELVEHVRVAAAQAERDGLLIVSHETREECRGPRKRQRECLCAHTTLNTQRPVKKTQWLART
jgi:hypothetical protein